MIAPYETKYGVHYHHIKLKALITETQIVDCQSPAFFMQYLARLAASANEGLNVIPTVITFLAPKYDKGNELTEVRHGYTKNQKSGHHRCLKVHR